MKKTRLGLVALAAASVFALASCTGGADADTAASGESMVVAVPATPGTLAFDRLGGASSDEVTNALNATLIRNPYVESESDPDALEQDLYDWEGVLAESYDVSDDGTVYTFHLRKDAVSQAGNPLTADDVLWSWERRWNSTSITPALSLPAIHDPAEQIKKLDEHTVQFTLDSAGHGLPFLSLISKITAHIYDSTLLKEHETPDDPYAVDWSAEHGNYGFGAYEVESFRDGEEYVLTANPDYVLGEPEVKRITFRVVPDAANRALLVRNGDVDAAEDLRAADVADLEESGSVQTFSTDTNNFLWARLNTTAKALEDPKVREAFFYAIPYQQIIDEVYAGRADTAMGLLDRKTPNLSSEGLIEPEYSPEKAKALLEEAGVTTPVKVGLMVSNEDAGIEETAVQIQSFAEEAGFAVDIETLPPATVTERGRSFDYDISLSRDMSISFESMPYTLRLMFPEDNPQRNRWINPDYYAAIEAGMDAGDSLSPEALEYWHQAELVWQDDRPMIQMARVQPLVALRDGIDGYATRTDNIIDWSIVSRD